MGCGLLFGLNLRFMCQGVPRSCPSPDFLAGSGWNLVPLPGVGCLLLFPMAKKALSEDRLDYWTCFHWYQLFFSGDREIGSGSISCSWGTAEVLFLRSAAQWAVLRALSVSAWWDWWRKILKKVGVSPGGFTVSLSNHIRIWSICQLL